MELKSVGLIWCRQCKGEHQIYFLVDTYYKECEGQLKRVDWKRDFKYD